MVSMDILLIGSEGQVAWELRRTLACLGRVAALGRTTQPALDLNDSEAIRQAVRTHRPNLIVNAAAYTAVDKAEQDSEAARRINAEAVGVLAEAAREIGAALIHYSTDYVFPGDADRPYREDDVTGPLGIYGQSKLQGEDYIRQVGVPHLILRTAWVYGGRGANFLLTMLRLMRERESLGIVADQHGAPTWSRMIAEATALLAARCDRKGGFDAAANGGIYHLTSAGETTWFGFASRIRELALSQGLLPETAAVLKPIPTSAYPTPAQRPRYSVLSNEKLQSAFGLALPHWDDALQLCLADMPRP